MTTEIYTYLKLTMTRTFNAMLVLITVFLSVITILTAGIFFSLYYVIQISLIIMSIIFIAILKRKTKKESDSFFDRNNKGKSKTKLYVYKLIDEFFIFTFYLVIIMIIFLMTFIINNYTEIFGSIMWDSTGIFMSLSRFDFVGWTYILLINYLIVSSFSGFLTYLIKDDKNYYLIMVAIVLFNIFFSCAINMPFRKPGVVDGELTIYNNKGYSLFGAYKNLPIKYLVFAMPRTHINYFIGQELYRMFYVLNESNEIVWRVSEEIYFRNIFAYAMSSEFLFTVYYPLIIAIIFKTLDITLGARR